VVESIGVRGRRGRGITAFAILLLTAIAAAEPRATRIPIEDPVEELPWPADLATARAAKTGPWRPPLQV